jgi:hypothetical protein
MFTTHTIPELAAQHRAELLADAEAHRLARIATAAPAPSTAAEPGRTERWWRRLTPGTTAQA